MITKNEDIRNKYIIFLMSIHILEFELIRDAKKKGRNKFPPYKLYFLFYNFIILLIYIYKDLKG